MQLPDQPVRHACKRNMLLIEIYRLRLHSAAKRNVPCTDKKPSSQLLVPRQRTPPSLMQTHMSVTLIQSECGLQRPEANLGLKAALQPWPPSKLPAARTTLIGLAPRTPNALYAN